jgi:hypothetical protein
MLREASMLTRHVRLFLAIHVALVMLVSFGSR